MRRFPSIIFAACLGLVCTLAVAQRRVEFKAADVKLNLVELRPLSDGGVTLTVHAEAPAADGGDLSLSRPRTCEPGELTAAQRTALVTVRNGALTCWSAGEGL